jgi:hypothetical protein
MLSFVDEHGVEPGHAEGLDPELWEGAVQQLAEGPDGEGQGALSGGQLFRGAPVLGLQLGALCPRPAPRCLGHPRQHAHQILLRSH